MRGLTERDLVALIKARLPEGSRLTHFEVNEPKDKRWVAQVTAPHLMISGYLSHFACSARSVEDALSRLLEQIQPLEQPRFPGV